MFFIEKTMKKVFVLFLIIMFSAELKLFAQDVDVELKNIRYKENCGCSQENPIMVKVCFSTDNKKKEDLKAVVCYSGNFTYTLPVKEIDTLGNIYYSFCSKQGNITNFEIYFRSPSGNKSRTFAVSAIPEIND